MNWKFLLSISLCFLSYSILAQQDVVVKNAPNINSDGMEFSPVLYQNGVVYVSRHKNGPVDQKTGETFFELFYAELDPNGFPLRPQDFSTELNSQVHEGPVSFNRRGDQIFFTRSNTQDGKTRADSDGRIGLKIYTAQRGYFDWENIPAPIQAHIVARAAAIVSSRIIGDANQYQILQQKEAVTRSQALEYECNQGDYSFFGSPSHGNFYRPYKPFHTLQR